MGWEVDNEEFESVLGLPGIARYEYFVKRAASHGQLWGPARRWRLGRRR
jgi:hypothetical protein